MNEAIELKDHSSKKFLERALKKGTQIESRLLKNEALDAKQSAELVHALMDRAGEEAQKRQELVDKLYEAKQREIRKNEMMAQSKIKELNLAKVQLLAKEKENLKEKAYHEQIRGRGIDFLKEIELGNAPPLQAIKNNLKIDPEKVRKKRTKDQIYEMGQEIAENGDERLRRMKEEFDRHRAKMGLDESWKEDLKIFFQNCNHESYQIAKMIMVLIMDKVYLEVDEIEEAMKNLKKKQLELRQKADRREQEIRILKHNTAVKQIREDIMNRVIIEMALETVKENLFIQKRIDYKMMGIFSKALKLERDSATSIPELEILAQNLEDDKLVAAREALMNQFEENEGSSKKKQVINLFDFYDDFQTYLST